MKTRYQQLISSYYFSTCLLLLIGFTQADSVHAEIYESIDDHGNVTFTDEPDKPSKEIELQSTNSIPAPEVDEGSVGSVLDRGRGAHTGVVDESGESEVDGRYSTLRISSPKNNSTIPYGPGNFSVDALVVPPLAEGDGIQLLVDGHAYGKPQHGTLFSLNNVFRGAHTLQLRIVKASGRVLKSSSQTTVYVFRPSVEQPAYGQH